MGRAVSNTFVIFPKTTEIGFVNLVRGSVFSLPVSSSGFNG